MVEQKYALGELDLKLPALDDEGVEIEEESVDEFTDGEVIGEPFNPTLIRVRTQTLTTDLIVSRIRENEIDLSPDFQRGAGIWNATAQSRLIESMLIKIPLPAFYMDAAVEDKWLVVDGLQRLTALKRFIVEQSLKLTQMEYLDQLDGKTFNEIPRSYQRRILETQLTVYVIEEGTPSNVKFNIFRRINTGGLPLSAQEIRHALNQGPATELLKMLARSDEFQKATNSGIKPERMADRECVLRFLAFVITPYSAYKTKDFDGFLNEAMKAINRFSQRERDDLERRFRRAMIAAYNLFGPYAFRKRERYPINKSLFETLSVGLDSLSAPQLNLLIKHESKVKEALDNLLLKNDFNSAISSQTSDIRKVLLRFHCIEQLIAEVLK